MVNQFLTLLDGVETLVGVFVICATTRPDVIDPALLRPGRLDFLLYMPLPDERGREDILRTCCKDVSFAPGVSVAHFARDKFDGYTGADIAAFVDECVDASTRRVIRAHEQAVERGEDVHAPTIAPAITAEDVDEALTRTRASLSVESRRYYDSIHIPFHASRTDKTKSYDADADAPTTPTTLQQTYNQGA
jgi:SpoVK/Ycf46/Vps4 family AAA+-type ATPase